jgi:hypothetical protein
MIQFKKKIESFEPRKNVGGQKSLGLWNQQSKKLRNASLKDPAWQ